MWNKKKKKQLLQSIYPIYHKSFFFVPRGNEKGRLSVQDFLLGLALQVVIGFDVIRCSIISVKQCRQHNERWNGEGGTGGREEGRWEPPKEGLRCNWAVKERSFCGEWAAQDLRPGWRLNQKRKQREREKRITRGKRSNCGTKKNHSSTSVWIGSSHDRSQGYSYVTTIVDGFKWLPENSHCLSLSLFFTCVIAFLSGLFSREIHSDAECRFGLWAWRSFACLSFKVSWQTNEFWYPLKNGTNCTFLHAEPFPKFVMIPLAKWRSQSTLCQWNQKENKRWLPLWFWYLKTRHGEGGVGTRWWWFVWVCVVQQHRHTDGRTGGRERRIFVCLSSWPVLLFFF